MLVYWKMLLYNAQDISLGSSGSNNDIIETGSSSFWPEAKSFIIDLVFNLRVYNLQFGDCKDTGKGNPSFLLLPRHSTQSPSVAAGHQTVGRPRRQQAQNWAGGPPADGSWSFRPYLEMASDPAGWELVFEISALQVLVKPWPGQRLWAAPWIQFQRLPPWVWSARAAPRTRGST